MIYFRYFRQVTELGGGIISYFIVILACYSKNVTYEEATYKLYHT